MKNYLGLAIGLVSGALLTGCNPTVDDNTSAVAVRASFQGPDDEIGFYSDVVGDDGTPSDDLWDLKVTSIIKNPNTTPGDFYIVDFQSYQVYFTRNDGRNEPGVDVPFPLTLAIGGELPVGGNAQLHTVFVTEEMKLQAPLRNYWFSTNQRLFTTMHVRVFGQDRVGNAVSADASTVVIFADL